MIYQVNGLQYYCRSKKTRTGFAHVVDILNNFGELLVSSKTNYYNRTWESYTFESAMRSAQEKLEKTIEKCKKKKDFVNYRWESHQHYNFDNEPKAI